MAYPLILSNKNKAHIYTTKASTLRLGRCLPGPGFASTLSLPHRNDALVDGFLLQEQLEAERLKGNPFADKVLAHGLNPVQS